MFGIIFSFVASQILYFALHLESSSFPKPLSARDEIAAFEAMKNGDMAARDKLIRHNLRLVAHIVKKYYASSTDQEDLISIGTIGLIKAVNSFDNTKGARFATYAARCIENAILPQMRRETGREYRRARPWRLKQKNSAGGNAPPALLSCALHSFEHGVEQRSFLFAGARKPLDVLQNGVGVHGGRPLCQFRPPRGGLGRIYDDLYSLPAHRNPSHAKAYAKGVCPDYGAGAAGRPRIRSGPSAARAERYCVGVIPYTCLKLR